jgi:uncharacterized glyoxalase superfamily protein PhnB
MHKPPGWPDVAPRIFTAEVAAAAAFIREVFGAAGEVMTDQPTSMRIGESAIMISDGAGVRGPTPAFLYVYVPDADAAYERALALGAKSIDAPEDMPWGDRRATVEDPFGNTWQIATFRGR